MKQVISFSGGRTSAYLVWLIVVELILKGVNLKDIVVIFMDTGAEHPKTYEFVRNIVKYWGINLVCLRVEINPKLGKGNSYEVISIDDIGKDLKPWEKMLEKYGTPYLGGAFCTDRMKTAPYLKYCNEHFGKGNYITWLGIRYDEPKRLIGDDIQYKKSAYKQLKAQALEDYEITDLFCKVSEDLSVLDGEYADLAESTKELIIKRINNQKEMGFRYLAQIYKESKSEILYWWGNQPFNLEIEDHLGNCVFCIKKSIGKVGLATKDERWRALKFASILSSKKVRVLKSRTSPSLVMYRGKNTLKQIIDTYQDMSRSELFNTLRISKRSEGGCSESCEVFNDDQLDLFKETEMEDA